MAKKLTEAHLCMELILKQMFGSACAEWHIEKPDYLERWRKVKLTKTGKIRKPTVWRHDYVVPMQKLAIEIEGIGKGHMGIAAFLDNMAKYNASNTVGGFSLLRFTPEMVLDGRAEATLWAWKKART